MRGGENRGVGEASSKRFSQRGLDQPPPLLCTPLVAFNPTPVSLEIRKGAVLAPDPPPTQGKKRCCTTVSDLVAFAIADDVPLPRIAQYCVYLSLGKQFKGSAGWDQKFARGSDTLAGAPSPSEGGGIQNNIHEGGRGLGLRFFRTRSGNPDFRRWNTPFKPGNDFPKIVLGPKHKTSFPGKGIGLRDKDGKREDTGKTKKVSSATLRKTGAWERPESSSSSSRMDGRASEGRDLDAQLSFAQKKTRSKGTFSLVAQGFVPDIPSLQRWLEIAWGKGFDMAGSKDFDQKIYGKRNLDWNYRIVLPSSVFCLRARIVDFCS
nr:zinc finger with UFM1-specific peptidase domain protein [Ipomoea batatas]